MSALAASGCSRGDGREDVSIRRAQLTDATSLSLTLNICNPEQTDVRVKESRDSVEVTITAKAQGDERDDCAGGTTVVLEDSLGSRDLVDGTTGREVRVDRRDR